MSNTEEEVRAEMGIQENDAAVIFKPNGELHIILPDHSPEEIMPPHVLGAVAIVRRLSTEPQWAKEILEWYDRKVEEDKAFPTLPVVGGVH